MLKSAVNARSVAIMEQKLLAEYTMAYVFDLGASFKIYECDLGPTTTIHFAVPVDTHQLSPTELDKLGEEALRLRDSFQKRLQDKRWKLKDVAIATTINHGMMQCGLLQLTPSRRAELIQQYGDEQITINPDADTAIKAKDWIDYLDDHDLIDPDVLKSVRPTDQVSEN